MPSPNQQLKILKTKAWAWTCARRLSKLPVEHPETPYKLAEMANDFAEDHERARTFGHKGWTKYLKGELAANPETVKHLWPFTRGAYVIGPLTGTPITSRNENRNIFFAPLWSAIAGSKQELIDDWNRIGYSNLMDLVTDDDGYLIEEANTLVHTRSIRNLFELSLFTNAILNNEIQISPMILFTAQLARYRIYELTVSKLYPSPYVFEFCSKEDKFKNKLSKLFGFLGIEDQEMADILEAYSLLTHNKLSE